MDKTLSLRQPIANPHSSERPVYPRRLRDDRKGTVAVLLAALMGGMLTAVALGVEASGWEGQTVALQRTADTAAMAGAQVYINTSNAHTAATAAGRLAQLNGIARGTTLTWNAGTSTLSGGPLTVQVKTGVDNANDTALVVSVTKTSPIVFGGLLGATQVTTSASGSSEAVVGYTSSGGSWSSGYGGGQPCLLALGTSGTTVTLTGSSTIVAPNCTVRSDGSLAITGTSSIDANSIYVGGTISAGVSTSITGTQYTSAGITADPYANYPAMKTLLAQLSAGAGTAVSVAGSATQAITPGTYSSISVSHSGTLTLSPGLYVVNGNVSVVGNGIMSGSGVTIVMSGTFTDSNSATINLTAPSAGATGGVVPGVVLAGNTSGATMFTGDVAPTLIGVTYFPNSAMSLAGSSSASPSCSEFIVYSATITGASSLSGACSSMGALSYSSWPWSYKPGLVN